MISRFLPLAGIVLFLLIGFVWRAWLQYRRYGQLGIILFHGKDLQQTMRDAIFLLMIIGLTLQALIEAIMPATFAAISFPFYLKTVQQGLGCCLLFGGTIFMAASQLHLGASWRIGIDNSAAPGLITAGFYQVCRNPIFLGMFIVLSGVVLLQPTLLSALTSLGAFACVHGQVLEEEQYLLRAYGQAYCDYASRTGRFIPGFGLLKS